ncbi:hypothetical protein AMECASPLE_011309 [Ameca splendens]|uniref:Uncharacterized protein n=1 Tax=Ameca splendens TaxID=208324 RepID=A0ABV0YYS2_9TELE
MHTLIYTPKGNLERPIKLTGMSLDCGRMPEYPERTQACTGRRPPAGSRTQDLLDARQQYYELHHHIAVQPSFIGFLYVYDFLHCMEILKTVNEQICNYVANQKL